MSSSRTLVAVDEAWRGRVERALAKKRWNQLELAKAVGCPASIISELLKGKKKHSIYVRQIEDVLGFTPLPSTISEELEELLGLWDAMSVSDRERLLERARTLVDLAKKK